jgi:unsaturated chondroitin disaccharide hydrolase
MWWKSSSIVIAFVVITVSGNLALVACPSADLTGDCFVNFEDFALMAAQWLTTDPCVPSELEELIPTALAFAADQLADTVAAITTAQYPIHTDSYTNWNTTGPSRWTSGFFSGCLWRMYELNNDPNYLTWAEDWMAGLEDQASTNPTQDLVFIIYNTFGTGYRLTGNTDYNDVVIQAAETVADQRYYPTIGAIVAGWGIWKNSVNIDSMMAIELLFGASKNSGQLEWYDMALSHSYKVKNDHVRSNGSTYQYVNYDPDTGDIIDWATLQGYGVNSTWSRGQAWALYGFTVAYRETSDPNLLETAKITADFFVDNLPPDSIPYWDFNAPGIPNTARDTSAAAIAASGLLELSTLVGDYDHQLKYYDAACKIMTSLCTPSSYGGYLSRNSNGSPIGPGIIMEGCYHYPLSAGGGNIYDESLVWGDYYFIEALQRYLTIAAP